MKHTICSLLFIFSASIIAGQTTNNQPAAFEGIVYSKTSFPGHPYDALLKQIDFTKGSVGEQFDALKHPLNDEMAKAAADDPQAGVEQMYRMALVLMPVRTTTMLTAQKSLTQMTALGYEWQVLIDEKENSGRMLLQSHNGKEKGTINFPVSEINKLLEKEEVGEYEGEYIAKNSPETIKIAGYPTKKITYVFSGTSQGPVAHSKIVTTIPWKITIWYSDVLDPRISVQNPFYFKLKKAVLKTEVEFDKEGKKKMLYEVTGIESRKVDEKEFNVPELGEVVDHQPGSYEALSLIMKVMTEAGKISWQ